MADPLIPDASFDRLRYSNVWEDAEILISALDPKNKRVLSICSAGDNVLSLIAAGASEVVAIDLSEIQLATLRLKMAAFRALTHDQVLIFLGIEGLATDRETLWEHFVQPALTPGDRTFWAARKKMILTGITACGRFEHYLDVFGKKILPWLQPQHRIDALREASTAEERIKIWQAWDHWGWRVLFRAFFSKTLLALGRDPAFLRHVDESPGKLLSRRLEQCLLNIPLAENPYLSRIIFGGWNSALPHYLRHENYETIRNGLQRVSFHLGPIQDACHRGSFDALNLSDILEYLDPNACKAIAQGLANSASQGARLVLWNMMVRRELTDWDDRFIDLLKLSTDLFSADKACFYRAFHVVARR